MPADISIAEEVRRWAAEAPASSILDAREAPSGPSNAARIELSRLASDPESPISFVRRHIYWKGEHEKNSWDDALGEPVDFVAAALHVAGLGAGLAGYSAARMFGWTHQMLISPEVAVVGTPPRGFENHVLFHSRKNAARRSLSAFEIALLEATIGFVHTGGFDIEYKPGHDRYCAWEQQAHDESECLWGWPDALSAFAGSLHDSQHRWGGLDPAQLVKAASSEWMGGSEMRSMIGDLADVISNHQRATSQ